MSWLERVSVEENHKISARSGLKQGMSDMNPGLSGEYDLELREKAGMHNPPVPPEYMGLEGEYDTSGLGKRVAIALDEDPDVDDVSSLRILQKGSTILLQGSAPTQSMLQYITEVAEKVDGTRAVDTSQVTLG